jgi:hypothetical protein
MKQQASACGFYWRGSLRCDGSSYRTMSGGLERLVLRTLVQVNFFGRKTEILAR